MSEYEDLLQRLVDEYDVPESEIEPLKASTLRKQLSEEVAKREAAESKVTVFEKAPKREGAFKKLNIDIENLSAAQRHLYETFDWEGDDPTEETVQDFVTKFEFPVTEAEASDNTEGARGIAQQAGLAAGAHPTNLNVDEQIAQAERDGNYALVGALKSQKLQAIKP